MTKKKTIICALIGTIMLTGCQATYREALNQKLENKTPEEKLMLLSQECASEIERTRDKYKETSLQHAERMKEICQKMTGQKSTAKKVKK